MLHVEAIFDLAEPGEFRCGTWCTAAAMSLDGFFAGPNGEYDWFVMDPETDFREDPDTFLIGPQEYTRRRAGSNRRKAYAGHSEHRLLAHVEEGFADYPPREASALEVVSVMEEISQ